MGEQSFDYEARRRRQAAELAEIRQKLNKQAERLAPKLLPNGRKEGHYWATSNLDDQKTGTYSLKVKIAGDKVGSWCDYGKLQGTAGATGDIFTLLCERECGGDFKAALARARVLTNTPEGRSEVEFREAQRKSAAEAEAAAARQVEMDGENRDRAASLWHGSVPIVGRDGLTPAYHYLLGRAIDLSAMGKVPGSLRYRPDVWNREIAEPLPNNEKWRAKIPAMIATVTALSGEQLAVHRTWLDVSGGKGGPVTKAKLDEPKWTLGSCLGGHIPVWKGEHRHPLKDVPAGTLVYMSEGIEDALSVAVAIPRARVIAGVAGSKMAQVQLPHQIGGLVIIGQNDPPGSSAADTLERVIAAHQERGRKVRVMFPPDQFKDFNDMLMGKRRGES